MQLLDDGVASRSPELVALEHRCDQLNMRIPWRVACLKVEWEHAPVEPHVKGVHEPLEP